MNEKKYFTDKQKKKAKREHLRFKNVHPKSYEKGRQKLIKHLAQHLKTKHPKWGDLKIIINKK